MAHWVGAGRGRKWWAQAVFFDLVEEYGRGQTAGRGKRRADTQGGAGRDAPRPALPFLSAYPGFGVELCGAFTELELQDVVVAYDAELLAC